MLSSIKTDYYSHPNKTLVEHLSNVGNNSKEICKDLDIENNNLYSKLSFLIGICHDFAKSTSYFQKYLFSDNPADNTEKKNHGRLSAVFGYYVVDNYLIKKSLNNTNYHILAYLVINRHHGNLVDVKGTKGENNYLKNDNIIAVQVKDILKQKDTAAFNNFNNFYKNYGIDINDFLSNYELIKNKIIKNLRAISKEDKIENYEELIMLYSILLDSDKLDASGTSSYSRKTIPIEVLANYRNIFDNKGIGINAVRDKAYEEVSEFVSTMNLDQRIYSLTLPTGIGKTMDILSFALRLRERVYTEKKKLLRVIYALPFLSIIDQNGDFIEKILSNSGISGSDYLLKHTSLTDNNYNPSKDEDSRKDNSAELLIEGWYSEIIITTFVQFFYTVISNKNKSLRKFHNLADSIIILDEVQSIPPKYWLVLKTILKHVAYRYNSYIIFMTATQPLIFDPDEIQEIIDDETKYIEEFDRLDYHFHNDPIMIDDFCEDIIYEIEDNPDKNIMIVLNTINSSKRVYQYISENIVGDAELIYLSTNIIPKDRLDRINLIKEESSTQKIIVTTQLIEAGVDIDIDIIYRDQAPIDSIIQTAGRCNRNNKRDKGIVHVIELVNENNRRYSGIYNKILLEATRQLTKDVAIISEKEFNKTIPHKYYKRIKEGISQKESRALLEKISKLELSNLQHDFQLIENTGNQVDVFIEKDHEATNLWNKYEEIIENHERYKFKDIKANFYNYVIHVYENNFGTSFYDEEKGIGYISSQDLERKYDDETGFIPEKEEDSFII